MQRPTGRTILTAHGTMVSCSLRRLQKPASDNKLNQRGPVQQAGDEESDLANRCQSAIQHSTGTQSTLQDGRQATTAVAMAYCDLPTKPTPCA
jgi:hypothetical protein